MSPARRTGAAARRHRSRGWWLATAVLVVVAAVSLTAGIRGHDDALSGPAPDRLDSSSTTGGATTAPPAVPAAPVLAAERALPVELRIPAIGVTVPVSQLGLNPDRTVEVPTNFQEPGWFRLGPTPGQRGSAVILGHVDSYRGPAVFFRLRALQPGDTVEVSLADGATARFAVTSVQTYPKSQFPAQQVYASHGGSDLQLVTCGGEFDATARSYLSNVVAYSSLVAVIPAP